MLGPMHLILLDMRASRKPWWISPQLHHPVEHDLIERITVTQHDSRVVQILMREEFAGVMHAAVVAERHSLARAFGRKKAPEPKASGAELSLVAGARNHRETPNSILDI